MTDWLELGVDAPFVAHDCGFMDSAIINWHDTFGMSNTKRRGPDDQLQFLYERDGLTLHELNSSASGLGAYFDSDIDELRGGTTQLGVGFSYRLRQSGRCRKFAVVEEVPADATTDFALHFAIVNRCSVHSPQ